MGAFVIFFSLTERKCKIRNLENTFFLYFYIKEYFPSLVEHLSFIMKSTIMSLIMVVSLTGEQI